VVPVQEDGVADRFGGRPGSAAAAVRPPKRHRRLLVNALHEVLLYSRVQGEAGVHVCVYGLRILHKSNA
jgi:hypothetical protein